MVKKSWVLPINLFFVSRTPLKTQTKNKQTKQQKMSFASPKSMRVGGAFQAIFIAGSVMASFALMVPQQCTVF